MGSEKVGATRYLKDSGATCQVVIQPGGHISMETASALLDM